MKPVRVKGTTWKSGNQVTGLHNASDWHDHHVWDAVVSRASNIEHPDVVIKCAKQLEQVHVGEQVWVKAKVRW